MDALRPLAEDRVAALALANVSRETAALLDRYVALLLAYQAHTNLIAKSTVSHLWTRHIADSLQLLRLAPEAKVWIDLGAGGGLPGLPIACALAGRPGVQVHLVESIQKKARFLREVTTELALPVHVHPVRIEDFVKSSIVVPDVVTARALAPLDHLLALAAPLLKRGAQGLFLKGQDVEAELTQTSKSWSIDVALVPSLTSPDSRIVVVKRLGNPKRTN